MSRALQRPLSTPVDEPTNSPFARLAQAAVLVSQAMAHCRRAVGNWNSYYEHSGAGKCSSGDALGDDVAMGENSRRVADDDDADARPVNIREVTALITELDRFCKACQADMTRAGAVPGSDAYFGFLTARCISWSTAMMVLDLYSCPEHMRPGAGTSAENGAQARSDAELALQVEAINGLKTAGLRLRDEATVLLGLMEGSGGSEMGMKMREETNSDLHWTSVSFRGDVVDTRGPPEANEEVAARISPLCLDVIYCGMSTFGWLWRESGDAEMKDGLEITRRCLQRIGTRWRLAGEYLEIGKTQDGFMMQIMEMNGAG